MLMMRFTKTHNGEKIAVILVLLITVMLLLPSCAEEIGDEVATKAPEGWKTKKDISEKEEICFDFFEREMINEDGGVRTNYLEKEKNTEFATGSEVLSESLGLMMLYSVQAGDEQLFESSYSFVKTQMDTGKIFAYRYDEGGQAYHVNAFVDDMRIVRALLLAGDAFGGGYVREALSYADRLYDTNVKNGLIFDIYDDYYDETNSAVTLCYIDLYTMMLLEEHDENWLEVYEAMLGTAMGGYISDEFPMFAGRYDYDTGSYSADNVNMIESLLTVLNLAMVGECPEASLDFLESGLQKGKIYAYYNREGGKVSDMESTAVYALCALVAKESGNEKMYEMSIENMMRFQVSDKKSKIYGAFADPGTLELYSFDNLMALLAMR